MILGSINSISDLSILPRSLRVSLEYLKNTDFSTLEDGEYEIAGRDVFAKVFTMTSKDRAELSAEYHNEYIDVQYWIDGEEYMGWSPREDKAYPLKKEEGDLFLIDGSLDREERIKGEKGDYMILFPEDIHIPGIKVEESKTYRKVVIKVRVRTL